MKSKLGAGLMLAVALVFAPLAVFAQATTENTLPGGIYKSSGTIQAETLPFALITKDSVSGDWCIVGSTATCLLPGAGGGGGTVSVSNAFNLEATQLLIRADIAAIAGAIGSAIPPGSALIGHTDGPGAAGAPLSGNPNRSGCRAATTDPAAVADAQLADKMCGATGKQIFLPYAIKELMVRGSTGATAAATQVSIIASAGGSLKNYITAIQCANSGASTSILTFTDANATVLINPAGGGGSWTFPVPLVTAAATAFQVTFGSASTSQYCSAQGYTGL